jgi:AcrR family transcriptional regulator
MSNAIAAEACPSIFCVVFWAGCAVLPAALDPGQTEFGHRMSSTVWAMSRAEGAPVRRFSAPLTAAQTRILDAALDLIAVHGVSATSYQMIADAVGITKAGVYRQFKSKEDLAIALIASQLSKLEDALIVAELSDGLPRAQVLLLTTVIDLAVAERGRASYLQFDPVITRLLSEHVPFQEFVERLYCVLVGDRNDEGRLAAAMLSGAISMAVIHSSSTAMDDESLRALLFKYTRGFVSIPGLE